MTNRTLSPTTQVVANSTEASLLERGLLLLSATIAVGAWFVMMGRMMSDWHPIWDLASHLSWHVWMATMVVVLIELLLLRFLRGPSRKRWGHRLLLSLPPWLYFTWVTSPWIVLPLAPNSLSADGLKVLSWNVWVSNHRPDEIVQLVTESQADVVVLVEVGIENAKRLESLNEIYPHRQWLPDYGARGIAVLSRVPETRFSVTDLADQGMPAIEARIPETERHSSFRLMAVHTRSPDLHERTLNRNKQLHALAAWATQAPEPAIVIGDLNITPWSPPFQRLLRSGHLVDSRAYRGNYASWPSDLGWFGIPIDHALVSEGSQILARDVGLRAPDSDHRPITLIVK